MEKINLYRYKRQILKLSSFFILLAALLAPVFAIRFTSEFYKKSVIDSLKSEHSYVVQKYKIELKTSTMKDQLKNVIDQNQLLYAMSKKLQERIDLLETHILNYSSSNAHIKEVLNLWSKNPKNWMMLSQMNFDGQLFLTTYELYVPESQPTTEKIAQKMIELGYKVDKLVEYNTPMSFISMQLAKITIQGRR